jgi:DNA-binding transcriptional LysR family regulator
MLLPGWQRGQIALWLEPILKYYDLMKFRQIEAFRAVMAYGSVTRAAESLHVTQPAVSRLISDFEAELGISLFHRDRGRLHATPEAKMLFQEANFAFSGMERLKEAAMVVRGLHRGRIRMVSETAYAESIVPRLAAAFHAEHPDVYIELDIGPSARIAEWVEIAWYDLGLVVLPVNQSGILVRPLSRQTAVCTLPRRHRLARGAQVTAEQLSGERFVSLVSGSAFRPFIDRAFAAGEVERDIRVEVRTQQAVVPFIAAGLGVSVMDQWIANEVRDRRIVVKPFVPEITWDLGLIFPASRPGSLLTNSFAEFLTAQCARPSPA